MGTFNGKRPAHVTPPAHLSKSPPVPQPDPIDNPTPVSYTHLTLPTIYSV